LSPTRHCGANVILRKFTRPQAQGVACNGTAQDGLNYVATKERGSMAEWFVAKAAELSDGDRRIVTAGPHEIGVFFKDGAFFAYSNYCLHSGGPACEGLLINRVVDLIAADRTYQGQSFGDEMHFVCPWHGYEYELKTGECVGDRKLKLRKYEVVRRGEDVFVVA
jgi:nitrite reductase/ring-hydroxylating ferredoxin subunit